MKKINNVDIEKIINNYQYGNITFLEAVSCIMNRYNNDILTKDEATAAIKKISKIKLPY